MVRPLQDMAANLRLRLHGKPHEHRGPARDWSHSSPLVGAGRRRGHLVEDVATSGSLRGAALVREQECCGSEEDDGDDAADLEFQRILGG